MQLSGSDFPAVIEQVLAETGLEPRRLALEVTDSSDNLVASDVWLFYDGEVPEDPSFYTEYATARMADLEAILSSGARRAPSVWSSNGIVVQIRRQPFFRLWQGDFFSGGVIFQ